MGLMLPVYMPLKHTHTHTHTHTHSPRQVLVSIQSLLTDPASTAGAGLSSQPVNHLATARYNTEVRGEG